MCCGLRGGVMRMDRSDGGMKESLKRLYISVQWIGFETSKSKRLCGHHFSRNVCYCKLY